MVLDKRRKVCERTVRGKVEEGVLKGRKVLCLCIMMLQMGIVLVTSGCAMVDTESEIYEKIQSQTTQFSVENADTSGKDWWLVFSEKAYDFCNALKAVAPWIIIGSFIIGIIILKVVTEDQAIRRKAIATFCVAIPVLVFAATYGFAWLIGTFIK